MKKQIQIFAMLLLAAGIAVKSQAQPQQPPANATQFTSERKGFTLDAGMSLLFLSTSSELEAFGGLVINGGYYTSAHSLWGLELGLVFGGGDEIGSFSYYYSNNPGKRYDDGKITRDYRAVPVLASWNYVFSCTEKFHLRLGPSLGLISLTALNSYDPSNIDGLPDKMSQGKALFAFGAGLGASWDILKHSSITVGYKLIVNSGGSFENTDINPIANQLNITWGWYW